MHVFDADAAVLHDVESGFSGFSAAASLVMPSCIRSFCANGDGFIDDRRYILRLAENIDDFDPFALFGRDV